MKSSGAGSGSKKKYFTQKEVRALLAQAAQMFVMDQGLYGKSKLMPNAIYLSE